MVYLSAEVAWPGSPRFRPQGSDLVYRMPNVEPLLATLHMAVPEGGAVVRERAATSFTAIPHPT